MFFKYALLKYEKTKKVKGGFFIIFIGFIISLFLNSCGKSLEEKKQEEGKITLSPEEKLSLAKDMLEIGQVSQAKQLFTEALKDFPKAPNPSPYCEALWGKYLSDLFGTLDLLSQLISLAAEERSQETEKTPRIKKAQTEDIQQIQKTQYLEQINNLIGQSVENVIGFFLAKINKMRNDLKEIIELNCEIKTKAASKFELSTPVISLEIWIPQNPEKSEKIPVYKKASAYFNYSLLSLIAGVLDIAYSQNYNISLTYALGFIKELTKEKDISNVLLLLGDFFANNPQILSLNEKNKEFWNQSATDLAELFYGFDNFYQNFCEEKDESEASKIMIEGLLPDLLRIIIEIDIDIDIESLCQLISPSRISRLFTKWGDGLAQKRRCEVIDGDKIEIAYNLDQDGCIRIPNDLQILTGLFGILQNIPGFNLPLTTIAFHPGNFFGKPTSLRNFLPLVRKIQKDGKEKFIFVIEREDQGKEREAQGKDEEHFKGEIFTLEYNESITRFGTPTLVEDISIPKDCVKGGPLYIAFSDPTFNNSLFITTYFISQQGDECFSWEQSGGLADETYYKVFDKKKQNYALNKLVNSLLSRFLPKRESS